MARSQKPATSPPASQAGRKTKRIVMSAADVLGALATDEFKFDASRPTTIDFSDIAERPAGPGAQRGKYYKRFIARKD